MCVHVHMCEFASFFLFQSSITQSTVPSHHFTTPNSHSFQNPQSSCWRAPRPETRALHDPPFHPVVDALAPLLHTITDVEQVLLALPVAKLDPSTISQQQRQANQQDGMQIDQQPQQQANQQSACWDEQVAAALEQVATWRGTLWGLCHGPLHVPPPPTPSTSPTDCNQAAHAHTHTPSQQQQPQQQQMFDLEAVSWVWRRLDKALSRLVRTLPALLEEDTALLHVQQQQHSQQQQSSSSAATNASLLLASRLAHARREGSHALGMQSAPSKPLLWRMGGRPLLPREPAALQARLHAAQLGRVAGLEGRAMGAVDVRGYPEALTAALRGLGDVLCAAADADEDEKQLQGGNAEGGVESMDVDESGAGQQQSKGWEGVEGLVERALHAAGAPVDGAEGSAEARHSVSRAVGAVLATDATLRRAVAQGLAMLAFAPVSAALAAPSQSNTHAATNTPNQRTAVLTQQQSNQQQQAQAASVSHSTSERSSEVVQLLLSSVLTRARSAASAAATLCAAQQAVALTDDVLSMGLLSGNDSSSKDSALIGTAAEEGVGSGQLLPARFMASPVCRHLQEGLVALHDVRSLRDQAGLLCAAGQIMAGMNVFVSFCVLSDKHEGVSVLLQLFESSVCPWSLLT